MCFKHRASVLDETAPSILEQVGEQHEFHQFDMDDLSRAVTQFRLLVLKNGNREAFSICEMGRWEVRNGLLNSTTLKLVATKTDERMEIEILKEVAEGSEENFQKWMVKRKCIRRMLCHPNLLHPLGYVMDENSRLVVHPSFERKTLKNILITNRGSLLWDNCITISVEAARGLAVLHGESPPVGFILCFKDTNIHLDENSKVKLLGFGLTDPRYHLTQILFYDQYFAPEYSDHMYYVSSRLLPKIEDLSPPKYSDQWALEGDVYGLGVTLLELVTYCMINAPVDIFK
ncbi:hypothetical protein CerSpe_216250 [Prunus speciosa]